MKVVFLDIDGVLNSKNTITRYQGVIGIDPFLVSIFNKILLTMDPKIVLSSSWRYSPNGVKEIEKRVTKLFDVTPRSENGFRGEEIKQWLSLHPDVEKYAILDDDSDFYSDQNLFKTSWEVGITEEIVERVIEYFKK